MDGGPLDATDMPDIAPRRSLLDVVDDIKVAADAGLSDAELSKAPEVPDANAPGGDLVAMVDVVTPDAGALGQDSGAPQDSGPALDAAAPACLSYDSSEEEFAPIQTTAPLLPASAGALSWLTPTQWTYIAPFSGTPGSPAIHEGTDYVHDDPAVPMVSALAASKGVVVSARTGCPQSTTFGVNTALRECGSGWGNHVVVEHSPGLLTRYAHLAPDSVMVQVGQPVVSGQVLAQMGNSGRSDVRHLHFELGTRAEAFDPCLPAQSMDAVHDPELLGI